MKQNSCILNKGREHHAITFTNKKSYISIKMSYDKVILCILLAIFLLGRVSSYGVWLYIIVKIWGMVSIEIFASPWQHSGLSFWASEGFLYMKFWDWFLDIQNVQCVCPYLKILFLRPFPVRNIIWTWVWLSMVVEIWVLEM